MAVSAATKTFKSKTLPVHESANLNIVLEDLALAPGGTLTRNYDFLLEDTFSLTDLQVTKTIKDLAAGAAGNPNLAPAKLKVSVLEISPGTDAEASVTATLAATTLKATLVALLEFGKKSVAGKTFSAVAGEESYILPESTIANSASEVTPNGTASASGLTRKRIRVRLDYTETEVTTPGAAQQSASCFVCMKFAKSSTKLESLGEIDYVS